MIHEYSLLQLSTLATPLIIGEHDYERSNGGSSVSQNKLPQLIPVYIYILKCLQSKFIG